MRILFLSPRQSLPARSGAKLREYHFLRALGRAAEVTYLYFRDPGATPLTVGDLPFCRRVIGIAKPSAYGVGKTLQGLTGRWPLPILNYWSGEMSEAVEQLQREQDFDLIHLDSIHMIRYALAAVERKPSLRAVYNWHNIESEALHRYSSTTASLARRWYAAYTAKKLERLERSILHSAFGHIVCSPRECEQLHRISPAARVAVIENGVDTSSFAEHRELELPPDAASHTVVFVGAMDYFPNSDAAVFFANRIWPSVRQRLADARLVIVGANPGPAVTALRELPGVSVTGIVPDVRPYYRGALAAIVPLRTGAGTRLKILEAMAACVPVVSTPLGAEGLQVLDGENIFLAEPEDTNAWVDNLTAIATSPAKRQQLTAAALQLVQRHYDWEILGEKLRVTYENWFAEG